MVHVAAVTILIIYDDVLATFSCSIGILSIISLLRIVLGGSIITIINYVVPIN
jgi:hypothetical protein